MLGVIGSGSWATEIVHILSEQSSRRINWWVHDPEKAHGLQGSSPRLRVSSDIEKVVSSSDDIFVVVPSAFLKDALAPLSPSPLEGKNIISGVKGFVPGDNITITRFFHQQYGVPHERLCIVSGPSHAEEVARCNLTYLTVATSNTILAERVREMLECDFLRTVYNDDMEGVECAAALKNVYAVAAGMCSAMGYGDNLMAVLVAQAVVEMETFVNAYADDARCRKMSDYVYLSDLLATCYSQHSRNRTFGELIARGYSTKEARLMQKMVAEGYYIIDALEHLRQHLAITMPVAQTLYRIIYEGRGVRREIQNLVQNLNNL